MDQSRERSDGIVRRKALRARSTVGRSPHERKTETFASGRGGLRVQPQRALSRIRVSQPRSRQQRQISAPTWPAM